MTRVFCLTYAELFDAARRCAASYRHSPLIVAVRMDEMQSGDTIVSTPTRP